ncbi:MAG TPA: PilZ domain-containing protein [Kofleriaceae bacterium]|nr:PilZ domain-containing protein [Kofleriaceae bacterium]
MVVPERAHPRYAHEAAVTFFVGSAQQTGRTKNLSSGGLCADLPEPIAAGTDVEVSVALVFADDAQSEALRLPARVAWCTPLDEGHQVGLAFRPLSAELTQYLGVFLRYLDDRKTEKSQRAANLDDRFR